MKCLVCYLLLCSSCLAGRFDVAIALALLEHEQAPVPESVLTSPATTTAKGGDPSEAKPRPKLWFYSGKNCRPCAEVKYALRTDDDLAALVAHFDVVEVEVEALPTFLIEGKGKTVYRGLPHFKQWLREQNFTKPEMR